MADNEQKDSTQTNLPNIITALGGGAGIAAIIGVLINAPFPMTERSPAPSSVPQVSSATISSHPAEAIIGTYKYRDQFGSDLVINFLSNGSATQSNGDKGRWYKEASGHYTFELESQWKIINLRLEGSLIKGTVVDPNGKETEMVGEKQ